MGRTDNPPTKPIDKNMTDKYEPIDIERWPRREHYEHFSRMRSPHYAIAANVDVTPLLAFKRREQLSFYLSLIYLATRALNDIDNFHLRFVDGRPVRFERIHTNFTHRRVEDDLFRYYTAPFEGTLCEYVERTAEGMAAQTTLFGGISARPNVTYFSCAPSLDATVITNPGLDNPDDAIPRINWGSYVERDGRWLLNITVTANHRFIDGHHIERFFHLLQEYINALEE